MRKLLPLLAFLALPCYAQINNGGGGGGTITINSVPCTTGSSCTIPTGTNQTSAIFNGQTFQLAPDGVQIAATWGAGGPNVTCSGCGFTSADVGKEVMVFTSCTTSAFGTSTDLVVAGTTIQSVTNGTQIVLSNNIASGAAGCFEYGTNNDTALDAVDTALAAATTIQMATLTFPAGNMVIDRPHFFANTPGCNSGSIVAGGTAGGTCLTVQGQGMGSTVFMFGNSFYGNMATYCVHGNASNSCFLNGLNELWRDFSFTGGGESLTGKTIGSHYLIEAKDYSVFNHIGGYNFGTQPTSGTLPAFRETTAGGPVFWTYVNFDGFGTSVNSAGDTGNLFGSNVTLADYCKGNMTTVNSSQVLDFTGGENLLIPGPCTPTGQAMVLVAGRFSSGGGLFCPLANGDTNVAYCFNMGANGVLALTGAKLQSTGGNASSKGILNQQAGTVVSLVNCDLSGFGLLMAYLSNLSAATSANIESSTLSGMTLTTGAAVRMHDSTFGLAGAGGEFSGSAGTLYDTGGNTYTGTSPFSAWTGGFIGGDNSVNTSPLVTGNLVLSANWGTSNASSAWVGDTSPVTFTVTNGTAATGASPTIAYTFPHPYPASPLWCNAVQVGGTNPIGTFASSSLSATGVTFTYSLTPTANDTEFVQVQCTAP